MIPKTELGSFGFHNTPSYEKPANIIQPEKPETIKIFQNDLEFKTFLKQAEPNSSEWAAAYDHFILRRAFFNPNGGGDVFIDSAGRRIKDDMEIRMNITERRLHDSAYERAYDSVRSFVGNLLSGKTDETDVVNVLQEYQDLLVMRDGVFGNGFQYKIKVDKDSSLKKARERNNSNVIYLADRNKGK